jgi:hypothetical protein
MKDIGARDIIIAGMALLVMGLTIYTTASMTLNIAARQQQIAIDNAVSAALESAPPSPFTCDENKLLESIKSMAENGIHMKGYQLRISVSNTPGLILQGG